MNIGKLDKRIIVQAYSLEEDETGASHFVWKDYKKLWASIEEANNVKKENQEDKIVYSVGYKIVTRYLRPIDNQIRIVYQGQVFKVLGMVDHKMKHKETHFTCVIGGGSNE